jgi:hypothetical protein
MKVKITSSVDRRNGYWTNEHIGEIFVVNNNSTDVTYKVISPEQYKNYYIWKDCCEIVDDFDIGDWIRYIGNCGFLLRDGSSVQSGDIGQIKLKSKNPNFKFYIDFGNDDCFWLSDDDIELLPEPKFKVGDVYTNHQNSNEIEILRVDYSNDDNKWCYTVYEIVKPYEKFTTCYFEDNFILWLNKDMSLKKDEIKPYSVETDNLDLDYFYRKYRETPDDRNFKQLMTILISDKIEKDVKKSGEFAKEILELTEKMISKYRARSL